MPIYEYYCRACGLKFELLQRMSEEKGEAICPRCQMPAPRQLSVFASFSKSASGEVAAIAGGGHSCSSCSSGNCSSCH